MRLGSKFSAWRNFGPVAIHRAPNKDWSGCADAQADLGLRWRHMSSLSFCWKSFRDWTYLCMRKWGLWKIDLWLLWWWQPEMKPYVCIIIQTKYSGLWKYHARLVRPCPISFRTSWTFLFSCPWTSTKLLIQFFCIENSVDPDQVASSEASWSGSTLLSSFILFLKE